MNVMILTEILLIPAVVKLLESLERPQEKNLSINELGSQLDSASRGCPHSRIGDGTTVFCAASIVDDDEERLTVRNSLALAENLEVDRA